MVANRLACNGHPARRRAALGVPQPEALGLGREFYDGQRSRNKGHHAALRALGTRWLEVLWHCLSKELIYDESIHVANRNRAMAKAA